MIEKTSQDRIRLVRARKMRRLRHTVKRSCKRVSNMWTLCCTQVVDFDGCW